MELDIPMLLSAYNDLRFDPSLTAAMGIEALPENKKPAACIGCGACTAICPQSIDIPKHLRDLNEKLKGMPSWAEICRQREAAAMKGDWNNG